MVPRENENNAYAKFLGDKQRVLWYFANWPIEAKKSYLHAEVTLKSAIKYADRIRI